MALLSAQRMKGELHYDMGALGGVQHLRDDIAVFGAENPLTNMCPVLVDVDPDDAFSSVPYEKVSPPPRPKPSPAPRP